MNLINEKVSHKTFGTGYIVDMNDTSVEVQFETDRKKFVFPDAFGPFLKLHNRQAAEAVQSIIQQIKDKKQQKQEEVIVQLEHKKAINKLRIHPKSQVVFWCDEDEFHQVIADHRIFAGVIKSGKNKGTPRKLSRLCPNSACLLTARSENEPEHARRIIGVFMVDENFVGKLRDDGYVLAHEKFILQLTEEEAKNLPFWKYYFNHNSPEKITWNTGKYRYFDNIMMAQILRDITQLKADSNEQSMAQQFFDYFCKTNQLNHSEIPEPNGALIQLQLIVE